MNFPLAHLLGRRSHPTRFGRGRVSYPFVVLAIAHLILGVAYLTWRTNGGMSEDAPLLSWVFLLAEGFTLVGAIGSSLSHLRYRIPPEDRFSALQSALAELPPIDIAIVRQKESIAATCQTAQLARELDYPEHLLSVRIVDCDADVALAHQASIVGCEYTAIEIERSKALYNLLQQDGLGGDYLLVLNVGQFPNRNLLKQLLPYFFETPENARLRIEPGTFSPC